MNEIIFTQKQMQEAMEHYLNNVVLKKKVKVTQVEYSSDGTLTKTFCVKLAEPDVLDSPEVVGS